MSAPHRCPPSVTLFFTFLLLLVISPARQSRAIQLHWSSGASDTSFTASTRATLVVQADPSEAGLPGSWRLQWVADSSGIRFVAPDWSAACRTDVAKVSAIDSPSTAADSAANQITAHLCSSGSEIASTAYFVLDLTGGSVGKLKVVALDPRDPDSTRVIESNVATYNGGVDGDYSPVVLHATSVHQSLELRVTAVGSGLNSAAAMSILALDSSWTLPLTVTSRSNVSLTGVAFVAALLPACQAAVGSDLGAVSAANLPPDGEPVSEFPQSCQAEYFEELLTPPPGHGYAIQPKDFAFVRGFVDQSSSRFGLHLFYIRHTYYNVPADSMEKNIGHIWTTDFNSWYGPSGLNRPDTVALNVRPTKFDALHVWAPTIVQHGPTFWMFYTGVRDEAGKKHQRIGVATSTDLNTWTPTDTVALSVPNIPWASKNPTAYGGSQQLRDPFVMEDPINPGQWLMYFVAVDSLQAPKMAVGAARSTDLRNWTALEKPFSSTERPTPNGSATSRLESPHVFKRNGQWWMPYTVDGDTVFVVTTTSADPADTVASHWTGPFWLRGIAEGQPSELQYWHATEYLRINSSEYLAAFNDNATSIGIKGVFAPANAAVDSFRLDCPQIAGVVGRIAPGDGVRMAVSRLRWGVLEVGLRLNLPSRMAVRLAIYDISGRRRTTLLDRELSGGLTDVTWDGRDQGGARVASGVYFVRLTYAGGSQISKLVLLR